MTKNYTLFDVHKVVVYFITVNSGDEQDYRKQLTKCFIDELQKKTNFVVINLQELDGEIYSQIGQASFMLQPDVFKKVRLETGADAIFIGEVLRHENQDHDDMLRYGKVSSKDKKHCITLKIKMIETNSGSEIWNASYSLSWQDKETKGNESFFSYLLNEIIIGPSQGSECQEFETACKALVATIPKTPDK